MSDQYLGQHMGTSGIVERMNNDSNGPAGNLDPYIRMTPGGAVVTQVEPVDGTFAAVAPVYGPLPDVLRSHENPVKGISQEEEAVIVSKMDAVTIIQSAPVDETIPPTAQIYQDGETRSLVALLNLEDSEHFRTRWNEIQGMFVDDPRSAVQQADALVSEVVEQITQMFASQHSLLEEQWNLGKEVSTEDLRKTLQHYRSFFNRLVG